MLQQRLHTRKREQERDREGKTESQDTWSWRARWALNDEPTARRERIAAPKPYGVLFSLQAPTHAPRFPFRQTRSRFLPRKAGTHSIIAPFHVQSPPPICFFCNIFSTPSHQHHQHSAVHTARHYICSQHAPSRSPSHAHPP